MAARARKKKRESSRSEELEAAVLADPSADAPRLVYADWLQAEGDPRGELAVVQSALLTARGAAWARLKSQERALLDEHAATLYGPLIRWKRARLTGVEWRCGFIDGIRGGDFRDSATLSEFLAHPSARFVRRLEGVDVSGRIPPALERFATFRGVFKELLEHPRLKSLDCSLAAGTFPKNFSHPALEELELEEADQFLSVLPRAKLPKLKHLALGFRGDVVRKLGPALANVKTERLSLRASAMFDAVAFQFLAPEVQARATQLSFHHDVNFNRSRFPNVKKLVVESGEGDGEIFETIHESLPALEEVELRYPSDRVRFFRAFATSAAARKVKRLRARVSKPAAGLALTEGSWDALEHLEVSFDETFSLEYLQAAKFFGAKCWANVKSVRLEPGAESVLTKAPFAKTLETLALTVDHPGSLRKSLRAFPKLRKLILDGPRQFDDFEELGELDERGIALEWISRA
ncbi:MAG: TIGR02996 domain-containing protein [Archangium sp.]